MIVYKNNGIGETFIRGDPLTPIDTTGDVIVAVDPSKTNMAVVIGSPFGEIYSILEFTGNNRRRGPVMDTTKYCSDFADYLKRYLAPARVVDVGVEKAITKKGMEHHHSNMTLTEIRGKLLGLFEEEYGFPAYQVEVNNYSWKSAVLPEGYRGHNEKGSKRFMRDRFPNSPLCNYFEADVTDVVCIYWYKIAKYKGKYNIVCNKSEKPIYIPKFALYPSWMDRAENMLSFKYNPHFTLEENAIFYANRTSQTGIAVAPLDAFTYEEIYKYSSSFTEAGNDIRVIVTRSRLVAC